MVVARLHHRIQAMERQLVQSQKALGLSVALLEEAQLAITAAQQGRARSAATSRRLAALSMTAPRPTTPTEAPEQR